MSTARFEVVGRLDSAGAGKRGTVLIDRETGLVHVRPLGSRTMYTMPLSSVATWICQANLAAQVRDQKLAKKAKRAANT